MSLGLTVPGAIRGMFMNDLIGSGDLSIKVALKEQADASPA